MSAPSVSRLRATAEEAARLAGGILRDRFTRPRTVELKGRIDLVTDADRASESAILGLLAERFPQHAVLAEESGAHPGSSYRWLIDPLDGTTNYAHQVPQFCVSIAVEGPAGLAAAAVYDPVRDELFSAASGEGATLNGAPLRVSAATELAGALLCTGFPYDVHQRPEVPLGLFQRLLLKARGVRRMGSAALDLAYVAAGRFDGFFEFGLKPWDIAAGALLIAEAGGAVCRIDGAPLDLQVGHIFAAGAALRAPLQAECAAFLEAIGWKL